MNKKLPLLFLFAIGFINAFATHYRAADITYRYVGYCQVEATVTTYSKFEGISVNADKDRVEISWGDGTGETLNRINGLDADSNGYNDGEVIRTSPEPIKKSVYTGVHFYPGMPYAGFYVIGFMDLNRIDGINNMQGGNSVEVGLYVQDTIFMAAWTSVTNSSPVFSYPPVEYANLNDPFTFNPVVYDADGDSLSFELIAPLQAPNAQVPLYSYPDAYCHTHGQPNNTFQINAKTGQVTWSGPCALGIYIVSILVREYRCGTLLSTVMSDMQIISLNVPNTPPAVPAIIDRIVYPGDSISFSVTASDVNSTQTVSLQAHGGAFGLPQNAPAFTAIAGNPASGLFTWQTDISNAQPNAYIFSVVAADDYTQSGGTPLPTYYKTFQTFRVWVTDTSDCARLHLANDDYLQNRNSVSLFPNPAITQLTINSGNQQVQAIRIYNTTGQLLLENKLPLNNTIDVGSLTSGIYVVEVKNRTGKAIQRFVKM